MAKSDLPQCNPGNYNCGKACIPESKRCVLLLKDFEGQTATQIANMINNYVSVMFSGVSDEMEQELESKSQRGKWTNKPLKPGTKVPKAERGITGFVSNRDIAKWKGYDKNGVGVEFLQAIEEHVKSLESSPQFFTGTTGFTPNPLALMKYGSELEKVRNKYWTSLRSEGDKEETTQITLTPDRIKPNSLVELDNEFYVIDKVVDNKDGTHTFFTKDGDEIDWPSDEEVTVAKKGKTPPAARKYREFKGKTSNELGSISGLSSKYLDYYATQKVNRMKKYGIKDDNEARALEVFYSYDFQKVTRQFWASGDAPKDSLIATYELADRAIKNTPYTSPEEFNQQLKDKYKGPGFDSTKTAWSKWERGQPIYRMLNLPKDIVDSLFPGVGEVYNSTQIMSTTVFPTALHGFSADMTVELNLDVDPDRTTGRPADRYKNSAQEGELTFPTGTKWEITSKETQLRLDKNSFTIQNILSKYPADFQLWNQINAWLNGNGPAPSKLSTNELNRLKKDAKPVTVIGIKELYD